MRNFWDQLSRPQKYLFSAGLAIVAVGLVIQFIFYPIYGAKKKMEGSLAASKKSVKSLEPLGREYIKWRQDADAVQAIAAQRPAEFSLFTYLEKKTAEAGVRNAVRYINPLKSTIVGNLEESSAELKLEKITLKQLAHFLYLVEAPQDLINVRKAIINKAKENPEYLNAVLQVVTYRRADTDRTRGQ